MGWWTETVVPRVVDRVLDNATIAQERRGVCAPLHGRVLELGFGSGLNVPAYPAGVSGVDAVEPSDTAWALSERRRASSPVRIARAGLDGQDLAAADGAYDCVLSTFTLCTIPDLPRALAQVRRVLRSGGSFCFLEHGRAPDPGVRRWQRRLEPLQRRCGGGCHLTRDIADAIEQAGLPIARLSTGYLPGPAINKPMAYLIRGRASRP